MVQQAGFLVLKSPDVPSILVETAYISNPEEEKKLRSKSHQDKLSKAILAGVRKYFYENPPPNTMIALNQKRGPSRQVSHVITRGDTLSERKSLRKGEITTKPAPASTRQKRSSRGSSAPS